MKTIRTNEQTDPTRSDTRKPSQKHNSNQTTALIEKNFTHLRHGELFVQSTKQPVPQTVSARPRRLNHVGNWPGRRIGRTVIVEDHLSHVWPQNMHQTAIHGAY